MSLLSRLALLLCALLPIAQAADSCPNCGTLITVTRGVPKAGVGVDMTSSLSFNAMDITIAAGDTVTWTNTAGFAHTTTSDTAIWDSGSVAGGGSFSHTFPAAGVFPYHCSIHGGVGTGMHGTVTVVGVPTITSASSATGTVNAFFTFPVTADQSPTSFTATGLPAGLSINAGTGVISGIPTTASGSPFTVALGATNVAGTGNQTFTLTLNAATAGTPVISSPTTASGTVGAAFSYTIAATNTPIPPFSASPLPIGLTLDTTTGAITGTPTAAGTTNTLLGATNANGTGNAFLTITIASAAGGGTATATGGGATGYGSGSSGGCNVGSALSLGLLACLATLARRRAHAARA